jgi:hypothetical protein
MIPQIPLGPRGHYLQWPTRMNAAQVKVLIGFVFVLIVTKSETCHIYKAVLQIINTVARTPSRVSELVATNHIINKARLDVGCYYSEGLNWYKSGLKFISDWSCYHHASSNPITNICQDTSIEARQEGGSAQDQSRWAHDSLVLRSKVPIWHIVPFWNTNVHHWGRQNPWVINLGTSAKSSQAGLRRGSIPSSRSVHIIDIE